MGGGGKGGGKQTIGFRYFMSLHIGLCRGPIDELVQINAGGLRAWPVPEGGDEAHGGTDSLMLIAEDPNNSAVAQYEDGNYEVFTGAEALLRKNTITAPGGNYSIKAGKLFGGDKKEGGLEGSLAFMVGGPIQIVPQWIKNLMGGLVPDFRGVTTLFYDGLLTSLNPYPKKWEFRVRRTERGWHGGDAAVWQPSLVTIWMRGGTIKAMNPAHIIYECLTNPDWGRGMTTAAIKEDDWLDCAQKLFDENFGLCLRYNRQSELSAFIQEVLDHIGGTIYPDRSTGQLSLGLLRGDYDPETIPLFTYDTGLIDIVDNETASQEDLVNETIVKWSDPITKEERSSRIQNIASRQTLGAINSTTTSYHGAPTEELALRLAQRDLKAGTNALKRYKVTLDRRAWRIVPGDVFRISVPERNIFNAVLRAGKVTEGGGTEGSISVEAILDVFGLPSTSFVVPQDKDWTPPNRGAQAASERVVREATYAELVVAMDAANLQLLTPDVGTIATVVGKPTSTHQAYSIETKVLGADSTFKGRGTFASHATVNSTVEPHTTTIAFEASVDMGLVAVGNAVQIGDEIGRLTDIDVESDGSGVATVMRGCADTIPQQHMIGTTIFFVLDEVGGDGREYAKGESVDVRVLPYTSTNELPASLAPVDAVEIKGRQGLPYPPGRVRVNGTPYSLPWPDHGDVTLTWAHRDRILQQDQLIDHSEISIGPEPGVSYRVRVYAGNTPAPVRTVGGITGTQFIYTGDMARDDGVTDSLWLELESVRGGLTSHQHYRFGGNTNFEPVPTDVIVLQVSDPMTTPFATGSYVRIPFYQVALDNHGAFSNNNRYAVPFDGNYRITLTVDFAGSSNPMSSGSNWELKIDNFSSPTPDPVVGQSASGEFDGTGMAQLDTTIALSGGDVISAYLRHDNGSTVTLTSAVLQIERLAE